MEKEIKLFFAHPQIWIQGENIIRAGNFRMVELELVSNFVDLLSFLFNPFISGNRGVYREGDMVSVEAGAYTGRGILYRSFPQQAKTFDPNSTD